LPEAIITAESGLKITPLDAMQKGRLSQCGTERAGQAGAAKGER